MPALDCVPERLRPFDVVVTVEIAAADCGGGELESPENETDNDGANYKLDTSYGRLGSEPGDSAGGSRHQSLNWCLSGKLTVGRSVRVVLADRSAWSCER